MCVWERERERDCWEWRKGRKTEQVKESGFPPTWRKGRRERNHAKAEGGSAREGRQGGTAPNVSWGFSVEGGISKSTVSPESFKEQQQKNVYFWEEVVAKRKDWELKRKPRDPIKVLWKSTEGVWTVASCLTLRNSHPLWASGSSSLKWGCGSSV